MNLLMINDIQILSLAFVGSLQNHCSKYFRHVYTYIKMMDFKPEFRE